MYPDGTLEKVLLLTEGDVPSHGIGIIIASEVGENSFGNSIPTPKSRSTKNPHNEGGPCPPADGGARRRDLANILECQSEAGRGRARKERLQ